MHDGYLSVSDPEIIRYFVWSVHDTDSGRENEQGRIKIKRVESERAVEKDK